MAETDGPTYRQMDYWARQGYVKAPVAGSGYRRKRESDEEVTILHVMWRLVDAGVAVPKAAKIARQVVEKTTGSTVTTDIGHGIQITFTIPERTPAGEVS